MSARMVHARTDLSEVTTTRICLVASFEPPASVYGTHVVDMISQVPTFSLVLDYGPRLLKTWTPEDEDGLLFALHHLERAKLCSARHKRR
jgi:hypothetical protein